MKIQAIYLSGDSLQKTLPPSMDSHEFFTIFAAPTYFSRQNIRELGYEVPAPTDGQI